MELFYKLEHFLQTAQVKEMLWGMKAWIKQTEGPAMKRVLKVV